jgi:hypothetical protein
VALGGEGSDRALVFSAVQAPPEAIDVLLMIDDSGSMGPHQAALSDGAAAFLGAGVEAGVDFHVGIVTSDMNDGDKAGRLQGDPRWIGPGDRAIDLLADRIEDVGTAGSGDEQGLEAVRRALTPPLSSNFNRGFRRANVPLAIVVLTDEDDQSRSATGDYVDALRALAGGGEPVQFHAIAGLDGRGGADGCEEPGGLVVQPAFRYDTVVDAFRGRGESLCAEDGIEGGAARIAARLFGPRPAFLLPADVPREGRALEVRVDGRAVRDWFIDTRLDALVFEDGAIPPAGARVDILAACR